jgi:xylan 1,4-beta-xylosidase
LKWGSTNIYTEDVNGNPIYDWKIVDRIFDTYLQRGVKPYVQIGFMPQALSTKPEPLSASLDTNGQVRGDLHGWAYPPKDYSRWAELVFQWTKHCRERYGRRESPNLVLGSLERSKHWLLARHPEEFRKLHDYAIDACVVPYRVQEWVAPTRREVAVNLHATF